MGKQVSVTEFPWDKYLMLGSYGIWDLCEEEQAYNAEVLPPIGYKEGEAL